MNSSSMACCSQKQLLERRLPESLKNRHPVDNKITSDGNQEMFSLITYNVLAECHVKKDPSYYSYADPQYLGTDFRHARILEELEYLNGDIVCLQEVSPEFYIAVLKDWFTNRGYDYHFIKRTVDSYDEGCATFYRTDKFICDSFELVELGNIAHKLFNMSPLPDSMKLTASERYTMHDVAVIVQLRIKGTNEVITVANTHIHFGDFVKPDLQILQIACLKHILQQSYRDNYNILCGDFNVFPDSVPYNFATTGIIFEDQWELMREEMNIQTDLINILKEVISQASVRSPFCSAYKIAVGQEPHVTSVDNIYRCCLDFILYREPVPAVVNNDISDKSLIQDRAKSSHSKMIPVSVLGIMPLEEILKAVPPSRVYPSDHFPLFVEFALHK